MYSYDLNPNLPLNKAHMFQAFWSWLLGLVCVCVCVCMREREMNGSGMEVEKSGLE